MYRPESVWEFEMVDRVKFGDEAVRELSDVLRGFDANSVLVFSDPGIEASGILDQVVDVVDDDIDLHVHTDIAPDPALDVIEAGIERTREVDPDALVALGGGSTIDVTKVSSVLAGADGEILDYVAPPTGGGEEVPASGIPTVAIPTTSGTGSETSPVAVISLPDQHLKVGISSRNLRPDVAIVDPTLTVSLPPGPTASSGVDALAHAIEAYTTRRFDAKERPASEADRPDYNGRNLLTDQFARKAIELIGDNLRAAVNNGEDLTARRNMAAASLMAGVAFTNAGLGATHAIAMAVGAEFDSPHGATIAAALPDVMRYNSPALTERYRTIAELLGGDVSGDGDRDAAERSARLTAELIDDVGLPTGLRELGVTEDDVPTLVEKTSQLQRLLVGNPRRVDEEALERLYEQTL